jgi:predicted nucleic acid-binding protein
MNLSTMTDHLLDSGILVRHLRNYPAYVALTNQLAELGQLYIATFTRFEIMRGMREHEAEGTCRLVDSMVNLPVNPSVADLAGELVRTWQARGIVLGEGDAIIAATAMCFDLDLVTTNGRHFPMPELVVWQTDEQGNLKRYSPTQPKD